MDFFEQETRARRQTRLLLGLFGVMVIAFVALAYLVVAVPVLIFSMVLQPFAGVTIRLWDPYLAVGIALGALLSITLGCLYKFHVLSAGGSAVAELLGGRRVEAGTDDPDERRLRNVIEEMAIASGTSVPEIYVLDNERGINAFAAGHTRDDVAIGVTRGCLKLLDRDELQGVIAHEFSHVLNGDTRLNMRLMALAYGLSWPTFVGRILVRGSTRAPEIGESIFDEGTPVVFLPTAPLGVLFLILGAVSLPLVRLLKSLICREREWLADAAAVQFTRNPAGLSGALKKIGGLFKQGRLDTPFAETASHLYFANSAYDPWLDFLATHPPLGKRIQAIDPVFDGQFPKVQALPRNQHERDQACEKAVAHIVSAGQKFPAALLAVTGAVTAEHIQHAATLRFGLPPEIKLALRQPAGAAAVIYGLLLSDDDAIRAKQAEVLRATADPAVLERATALAAHIQTLGPRHKFALAEFAVPALREFTVDGYTAFDQTVGKLVECDGAIELFEYTLLKMLARQLRAYFAGPDLDHARYGEVGDALPECALLLSALAHVGEEEDEPAARSAFAVGQRFLDAPGAVKLQFIPRSDWTLAQVDTALTRLAKCLVTAQRNILLACGKTVACDGQVTEREAELLRAIADAMDCPIPPFVEAIRAESITQDA